MWFIPKKKKTRKLCSDNKDYGQRNSPSSQIHGTFNGIPPDKNITILFSDLDSTLDNISLKSINYNRYKIASINLSTFLKDNRQIVQLNWDKWLN